MNTTHDQKRDNEGRIISDYVSAVVAAVIGQSRSLGSVDHAGMKGHFNEQLLKGLLSPFLPKHLRTTSGKLISRKLQGNIYNSSVSKQVDLIVYDSRLLAPFVEKTTLVSCGLESE